MATRTNQQGFQASSGTPLAISLDGSRDPLLGAQDTENVLHRSSPQGRPPSKQAAVCLTSVLVITLTGGSSNTFGLYGPRLIRDLHFSQYHVGAISTVMMASIYSIIPILGRICQLTSPRFLSLLSAILFGGGYLGMERIFSAASSEELGSSRSGVVFPFAMTLLAFAAIGSATSAVIIASITACARTFDSSPRKGLFMSLPIASLGVSGMLHGHIAVTFFSVPSASDPWTHELSVVRFFRFLAALSFVAGLVGSLGLHTPDSASGSASELADGPPHAATIPAAHRSDYGTHSAPPTYDFTMGNIGSERKKNGDRSVSGLLRDPVLWYLAMANLLIQGVCEVYNMNMGSIIQSNLGGADLTRSVEGVVAQHITGLAISSTFARLAGGFLFDRFPAVKSYRAVSAFLDAPLGLLHSPVMIFLVMGAIGSFGLCLLAAVSAGAHAALFLVTTLIGLAYGASSSLAPLATLIWTQQQFPVAYGIINMTPAAGIGLCNLLYSHFYEQGTPSTDAGTCFGWRCYGLWAECGAVAVTVSLVFVLLAWWTLRRKNIVL